MFPLIGISGSMNNDETQLFLFRNYMQSILSGGGVPVLLSPDLDGEALEVCLSRLDGLLLAGGNDVSPLLFGERPIHELGEVNPLRDVFETRLIRRAKELRMPVLGICRGVQIMNTALGGTLWQDLSSQFQSKDGQRAMRHSQTCPGCYPSHHVTVLPETLLSTLIPAGQIQVNSFHHQAVAAPAPSLRISAVAEDGVIEAVECPSLPFFLGVQWHPERMTASDEASRALFSALCRAASSYGDRSA